MTKDFMLDLLIKAWGGVGLLAVAILLFSYVIWRLVKKENDSDMLSRYSINLIEVHQKKAQDAEAVAVELRKELDLVSKERNLASSREGELLATNQYYVRKIEEMQVEIQDLQNMVSKLLEMQGVLLNEIKELREDKNETNQGS